MACCGSVTGALVPEPDHERGDPVLAPGAPSLRSLQAELLDIERSGIFTNYGPVNTRFKAALEQATSPGGACLTVCNATIGLMMVIRAMVERAGPYGGEASGQVRDIGSGPLVGRRYALMPSGGPRAPTRPDPRRAGRRGIGAAAYFTPHVAEQPFFRSRGVSGALPVTERVSASILALPTWDGMTADMVVTVCRELVEVCRLAAASPGRARVAHPLVRDCPRSCGRMRPLQEAPDRQVLDRQVPDRQEPLPRAQAS